MAIRRPATVLRNGCASKGRQFRSFETLPQAPVLENVAEAVNRAFPGGDRQFSTADIITPFGLAQSATALATMERSCDSLIAAVCAARIGLMAAGLIPAF